MKGKCSKNLALCKATRAYRVRRMASHLFAVAQASRLLQDTRKCLR